MANKDQLEVSEDDLHGKLVKRLLVAGGMVAALLAVLAFFDYLVSPDEAPEHPVYNKPVPVPPKKGVTQPVKPTSDLPEPPKAEPAVSAPPEPPPQPPVVEKPATPEAPPKPDVAAKPFSPASVVPPASKPAPVVAVAQPAVTAKPVSTFQPLAKGSPASSAVPAAASKPAPAPVITAPAAASAPTTATPAKVLGPDVTSAPVPMVPDEGAIAAKPTLAAPSPRPATTLTPAQITPPSPPRLFSGYVVQAGVFSNAKAAEELHAKLALNGIPSTLEARVQVGPFKSKEEAEAARQKLKALGIEGLMIPPAGGVKR